MAGRRSLLLARIALARSDHHAAQEHLQSPLLDDLTPRRALVRQILLAAAAIERGDPMTAGMVGGALEAARRGGFLNTVVTTAPQVTSYLVEHSAQVRPDPFMEQLISAALAVRATQPDASEVRPARPRDNQRGRIPAGQGQHPAGSSLTYTRVGKAAPDWRPANGSR